MTIPTDSRWKSFDVLEADNPTDRINLIASQGEQITFNNVPINTHQIRQRDLRGYLLILYKIEHDDPTFELVGWFVAKVFDGPPLDRKSVV